MARRGQGDGGPTTLRIPRSKAVADLTTRIADGEGLLSRPISDGTAFKQVQDDYFTWDEVNSTFLRNSFTTEEALRQYSGGPAFAVAGGSPPTLAERVSELHDDIRSSVRRLTGILEGIQYYDAPPEPDENVLSPGNARPESKSSPVVAGRQVFIVHGHTTLKFEVALWVGKVTGLETVLLSEEANRGRTILEKFLDHSQVARFAIVLMTADDHGSTKVPAVTEEEQRKAINALQPRARQNVVLELGFYFGALGRQNVAVLRAEGLEEPSDLAGLGVIPIDSAGAWRGRLAQELRAADIEVDEAKYP